MKKILLVGYYGYKNYGDDLLLNSFLKIFDEMKFDGVILLPLENKLEFSSNYTFDIQIVPRFNLYEIKKAIKESDLVVFGGGNLFQTETSYRSFLYYYCIANVAAKENKTILLLSQGFGSFKKNKGVKKLKKILCYPKLYGILRDKTSYEFATKINKNLSLGVDIGPYVFFDYEFKKTDKIAICLKEDHDLELLISFLSTFSNFTISTLAINANQDIMKNYDFVEKIRKKTNMKADLPIHDFQKITEEIAQSKIVISDRLHSSLAGIFFEAKTLTYNNIKNRRVIKNIKEDYSFFYKNTFEIPFCYYDLIDSKYDFKNLSAIYKDKIEKTVFDIKKLIQSVL
ncbi:MAG TPA: polysaccharide pyruvyl transferase family protein [Defluviitoga sp.]|nr:polysaccharide pyruvyl transferase family protein [Defluviitoga sp.]HOP24435.1 polysaccharide pyruvyl transferase family protein [Defluviitoga sp.]HPZ28728.1 polysaccharide pyruvyl transferase family protein [Defluviitoga sp.]HQD62730.1 polysaccharide pyruvyl transferase family protein [Defluviitoga sp.]